MPSRQQKVKAIVLAIEAQEFSRNQIYPTSRGLRAGKLFESYQQARKRGHTEDDELYSGGSIGDGVIDKMYQNLLALRGVEQPTSEAPSNTPPKPPQQTKKTREKTSGRKQQPPPPPGVTILRQELSALRQQVEELHRGQHEIAGQQQEAESLRREVEAIAPLREEIHCLRQQNEELQQALNTQQQEVEDLRQVTRESRRKVADLSAQIEQHRETENKGGRIYLESHRIEKPPLDGGLRVDNTVDKKVDHRSEKEKLHGFALTQRKAGAGLNYYWYAGRRFNGKLCWVFVGKDKSKAKEKIEAWLVKRGLLSEQETDQEQNQQNQQGDLFDGLGE